MVTPVRIVHQISALDRGDFLRTYERDWIPLDVSDSSLESDEAHVRDEGIAGLTSVTSSAHFSRSPSSEPLHLQPYLSESSDHFFAHGDRGGPPPQPAADADVDDDNDILRCPLCLEEQPFVGQRGGPASSGLQSHVNNYRELVFKLEQILRGQLPDHIVFSSMLKMRQRYIEEPLRQQGLDFTPWKIEDIQRHFDVIHGHTPDHVRKFLSETKRLQRTLLLVDKLGLFVRDPDSMTGEWMFNQKAVDPMVRLSKHYSQMLVDSHKMLHERAQQNSGDFQSLVDILHQGDSPTRLEQEGLHQIGGL